VSLRSQRRFTSEGFPLIVLKKNASESSETRRHSSFFTMSLRNHDNPAALARIERSNRRDVNATISATRDGFSDYYNFGFAEELRQKFTFPEMKFTNVPAFTTNPIYIY
jgi:hypothetical protein